MSTAKPSRVDPWNQTVPTLADGAIETIDGKDPGQYRKIETNGYAVSRELTPEISFAFASISTPLLARLIKVLKCPTSGSRTSLIEAFQDSVIRCGVKILVSRLTRQILKRVSVACNVPSPKQRLLLDAILRIGLPVFLHEKCDVPMFVEFCAVLGLDSGRGTVPVDSSIPSDPTSTSKATYSPFASQHAHPVQFTPTSQQAKENSSSSASSSTATPSTHDANTNYSSTTLAIAPTLTSKSSTDLERELADELMLVGTEDLLKTLPVPLLQEICQELTLLDRFPNASAPTDAYQLIDVIMDYIFDLVPFAEYTQLLQQQQQEQLQHQQQAAITAAAPVPVSTSNSTNSDTPSKLSSGSNSKKRKREDEPSTTETTASEGVTEGGNDNINIPNHNITNTGSSPTKSPSKFASTNADTSNTGGKSTSFPLPTAPASKRAKTSETSSAADTSVRPKSAPSGSMDVDEEEATESKQASSSTVSTPVAEVKRPRGRPPSNATAAAASKNQEKKESPPKLVEEESEEEEKEESEEEEVEEDGGSDDDEEEQSRPSKYSKTRSKQVDSETDDTNASPIVSPPRRRGRPPKELSPSSSTSKESSSYRKKHHEDKDNTTSADSDDDMYEEDHRPSGKGRAKYQAPPLSHIKKGITGQDLHNLYNVTDLQDWCRQHSVDHTGKKSAVIKRILYQLDPTNAKPPPPKKSRRFTSR